VKGGIKTPELANDIVTQAKSDMVGIGRAMLKDSYWTQKAIEKLR
jgi:2,4-dienoyl-CoA reductase-like NADH-dependent reductase (Old Yellow Enzyme family)